MSYTHGWLSVQVHHGACEGLNRGPHCRKETPLGLNVSLQFVDGYVEGRVDVMLSSA